MRVCFFVHNWHYISTQDSVRAELVRRGIGSTVFVLRAPDAGYFEHLRRFQARDVDVHGFEEGTILTRIIERSLPVPFFGMLIVVPLTIIYARRYFKRQRVNIIATTDDRSIPFVLCGLFAARKLSIPVILLPIETISFAETTEAGKAALPPKKSIRNRLLYALIKYVYPLSVRSRDGRDIFFHQLRSILPLLLFRGLLPRNPWVRGSNPAVSMSAVNSAAQIDENMRHDIPPGCMERTGFPPHDRFSVEDPKMVHDQFARDYNTGNRPIFLFVGTHFTGEFPTEDLPKIHDELCSVYRAIVSELPEQYVIVVKFHPRTNRDEEVARFGPHGSRTVIFIQNEWDIYKLISISSAIGMFTSSAVLAAMATDAPVVAYEIHSPSFEHLYRPFTSIDRIYNIDDLKNALRTLSRVLQGEALEKRLRDREELGMFDGKCSERVANLIEKVGSEARAKQQ